MPAAPQGDRLPLAERALPEAPGERKSAPAALPSRAPDAFRLLREQMASQIAIGDAGKAARLARRAISAPLSTYRWLAALENVRFRSGARTVPYRLVRKASQPFLNHALSRTTVANLLASHYERLLEALDPRLVRAFLRAEVIPLAGFKGRSGADYELKLAQNDLNAREGELFVMLVRKSDERTIAVLCSTIGAMERGGAPDFWIGGLQGCKGEDGKAVTVQATRDLWGLRPKDLMIHAAYALGGAFGAARIKAVSTDGHVLERSLKGAKLWHADYDGFWRELGGEPLADGFFLLPEKRPRRSIDDVPSDKRSAWRARYALIDEIGAEIGRFPVREMDSR
jgi:uncharacterized protein VirK/YbjX